MYHGRPHVPGIPIGTTLYQQCTTCNGTGTPGGRPAGRDDPPAAPGTVVRRDCPQCGGTGRTSYQSG